MLAKFNEDESGVVESGHRDRDGVIDLLRCCGTDRPVGVAPLLVDASKRPFVATQYELAAVPD